MQKTPKQKENVRPHVTVLTETTHIGGRNILRGIAQYVREHEPWSVYYAPRTLGEKAPDWLKNRPGDGIIARISSETIMDEVRTYGKPVVDAIGGMSTDPDFPRVLVSDEGIGRKAAEYFMRNGFHRFAFLGMKDEFWSFCRRVGYLNTLHDRGFTVKTLELPSFYDPASRQFRQCSWEKIEKDLAQWVTNLPCPCAVFCANDDLGRHLIEACRCTTIDIPDEVAILGVDNDTLFCELCDPPLASIDANHFQAGYEAARLLDRLMRGEKPESPSVYVPPGEIKVRASCDVLAVDDRNLGQAMYFIRQYAGEDISVDDVAEQAFLSRSVLQRRFKTAFGQTVHERILQERMRRAQDLIANTPLSLAEIAEKAGFKHHEYMGAIFKKRLQMTPAQYRQRTKK